MNEITKHYTNGELTIVWKPSLCIHAAECVKALPNVYKPKEKPWIKAEGADTNALKAQIAKCPSGALSYKMNEEQSMEQETDATKVEVKPNGPLMVFGTIEITKPDGSTENRSKATAFCRCGQSDNKPFCDGTHRSIKFE